MSFNDTQLGDLGIHQIFYPIDPVTAKEVTEFIIKANYMFPPGTDLTLFTMSPGGEVDSGLAIIDFMNASALDISTRCVGSVSSMAAFIFMSGTKGKRIMTRNAHIMSHQFSHMIAGKHHELLAIRDHHDNTHDKLSDIFRRCTKASEEQIAELLGPSDRYLSAEECLELGICDLIVDTFDGGAYHADETDFLESEQR